MPTPPPDEQMDGASAEDSDDRRTADDDTEDEFALVPDTPEEKDGRADDEENVVPWDNEDDTRAADHYKEGREYDDRESDAVITITIRPVRAI